jgi:glutathione peroxidase-family protein
MKSIYDIQLSSAEGTPNHLQQYKGKVTLVVNTTVGCGNANQLEVLQMLQDKYNNEEFEIIAVPTNDYCGPGVTKGKWSQGITCGLDSKSYGEEVYNTTFKYSEMISSVPHELLNEVLDNGLTTGTNGLGQPTLPPHELYEEISFQMKKLQSMRDSLQDENVKGQFKSPWLNIGFYDGVQMGGNYEKYLIDKDGYVIKHFTCTVLNYDIEKTLKEALISEGITPGMGEDRSPEIFEEEFNFVCSEIEKAIAGSRSPLNPKLVQV